MSRRSLINAVAAAVVGLLVLGYWGYTWQQKRALDHGVAALVTSLANLLDELRPVSKALAAHAGMAAILVDEGLRVRARDAARAEAEQAEAEMDKIRKYPPLR